MERPWPCPRGDRERDKPLPVVLRRVRFCVTPWVVVRQAPLSIGFSRQEDWSGLPLPSPGNCPDPGIKPASLESPALADGSSLPAEPPRKPPYNI